MYEFICSATLNSVECGIPDGPNCTLLQNALDHFKNNTGDVLLWPESLNTMASPHVEPFAKPGTVVRQLLHAFGSKYRSSERNWNKVLTLTDTVPVDTASWSFMVLVTIFVAMIFGMANRSKVEQRSKIGHHPLRIVTRMIELIFSQSDYLLLQPSIGFKLLFASFLFLVFFSLSIYRTIFGTELTVSKPEKNIDTIDQFNQSNYIPFMCRDESMSTLLGKNFDTGSNDDSVPGRLLKLIRSRSNEKKSFGINPRDVWFMFASNLENSLIISAEYFHTIFERITCLALITTPNFFTNLKANHNTYRKIKYDSNQKTNYDTNQLINLYHVSDEKFLPIVTAYIYNINISPQLESRLNQMFQRQLEHGLIQFHEKLFPKIALPGDQIDHCINSIPVEGSNKDGSIPDPVVIDSLGNIFRFSAYSIATSFILVLIEIMVREIVLSIKRTPVTERRVRIRERITAR